MTPPPTPRPPHRLFPASSASEYVKQYASAIHSVLTGLDSRAIDQAVELLQAAVSGGKRIFVAGNGGSAAISEHLCCDWSKGTRVPQQPMFRTHSLVSNLPLLSAISNDHGYAFCFSMQLEMFAEKGDLVVLISSSGNSANVLNAAEAAKRLGMRSIGFTGFDGGKLASLVDAHLHAGFENYGVVEDCHQILMHVFGQFFARLRNQS